MYASDIPQDLTKSDNEFKRVDRHPYHILNKLAVEFLGSILLAYIGLMSGIKTNGSNHLINISLASGFIYFVWQVCFGGCHLNPVLSLATLLAKKIGFKHFVCYLIAQFVGSFCGAMLVTTQSNEFDQLMGVALYLPNFKEWYQALLTSCVMSTLFILNFLLSCLGGEKASLMASLSVGLSISLSILGTGFSINPAYDLAVHSTATLLLNLSQLNIIVWRDFYVFIVGPLLGLALAFVLYRVVFARSKRLI